MPLPPTNVLLTAGTTMVTVMVVGTLTESTPRVAVTTPPEWLMVQPAPEALTNVASSGSVSLTTTSLAANSPRLLMVKV